MGEYLHYDRCKIRNQLDWMSVNDDDENETKVRVHRRREKQHGRRNEREAILIFPPFSDSTVANAMELQRRYNGPEELKAIE